MYIVCSCLVYFDQSCLVWETFSCVEVVHFHFDQLNSLTWLNLKWIPVFEMVHIVEVVSWWGVFFFQKLYSYSFVASLVHIQNLVMKCGITITGDICWC